MRLALQALGEPYARAARPGLRALARRHRPFVHIADPRRLSGSIDLDGTLAADPMHRHANRWDYGVGFVPPAGASSCAVWIEVHPVTTAEVPVVIAKKVWLETWLRSTAPALRAATQAASTALPTSPFVWVATGGLAGAFTKHAISRRGLAENGLDMPVRTVRLP